MRNFIPVFCLALFSCLYAHAQFPTGFTAISLVPNLDPTVMTLAPNGDLLLCEKSGRVLIVRNGQLAPQPMISLPVDNFNERGLSGIAVHPDYPVAPYVYIYYTVPGVNHNRVVRFEVFNDKAVLGSEQTLLDIDPMPGAIHNGGAMPFGPDGMLYIAVGDGAGFTVAQSLQSLLGKVLRIRPDGTIPEDNPFYQQTTGQYRAIWAIGLRNPFTFTIQPGTGRMAVGDVGSDQFEEINIIEKGKNYGWPLAEGPQNNPLYTNPLHAYNRQVGCCVAGAAFYNPTANQFPAQYQGMLFFGEYCEGKIWYINPATGGAAATFATGINRPIALLTHPDGSMYCITRGGLGGGSIIDNTSSGNGILWRINYNPLGLPIVSTQPVDAYHATGEMAQFQVTTAGNAPFSFQWIRNGADIPGATAATLILPNVQLADSGAVYACKISNLNGATVSNAALLRVTANQRPTASIELPAAGARYRAGEVLAYKGAAFDPENGPLAAPHMAWWVDFHHNDHAHPAVPYTSNQTQGSFVIPQTGETSDNVWYRVHLRVEDDAGLSTHVWQDVFPEKSYILFQTEPDGLPLYLDGQPIDVPIFVYSVEGLMRSITAPQLSLLNGEAYFFEGWWNGALSNTLEFTTPQQDIALTANYKRLPKGTGAGLLGLYFNDDTGGFEGTVDAWRIDPEINFNWGNESPYTPKIGGDNFSIRWLGEIEPWLTGGHLFYITADDGVRLWIDNELIIDSWIPSDGETRTSMPVFLEAGRRYPIRLEFNEIGGNALIKLEWGFGNDSRILVPASQLYPAPSFKADSYASATGKTQFKAFPNPFDEQTSIVVYAPGGQFINMEVYDLAGHLMLEDKWYADKGFSARNIELAQAAPGMYLVKLRTRNEQVTLKLQKYTRI